MAPPPSAQPSPPPMPPNPSPPPPPSPKPPPPRTCEDMNGRSDALTSYNMTCTELNASTHDCGRYYATSRSVGLSEVSICYSGDDAMCMAHDPVNCMPSPPPSPPPFPPNPSPPPPPSSPPPTRCVSDYDLHVARDRGGVVRMGPTSTLNTDSAPTDTWNFHPDRSPFSATSVHTTPTKIFATPACSISTIWDDRIPPVNGFHVGRATIHTGPDCGPGTCIGWKHLDSSYDAASECRVHYSDTCALASSPPPPVVQGAIAASPQNAPVVAGACENISYSLDVAIASGIVTMNFANPSFTFTPTSLSWESTDWSTAKSTQACANSNAAAATDLPYATVTSTSPSYTSDAASAFRLEAIEATSPLSSPAPSPPPAHPPCTYETTGLMSETECQSIQQASFAVDTFVSTVPDQTYALVDFGFSCEAAGHISLSSSECLEYAATLGKGPGLPGFSDIGTERLDKPARCYTNNGGNLRYNSNPAMETNSRCSTGYSQDCICKSGTKWGYCGVNSGAAQVTFTESKPACNDGSLGVSCLCPATYLPAPPPSPAPLS
jgi:hypothetical protein